jgi:1,2-diacylglycerol 3-alpha-glucosyltransferase
LINLVIISPGFPIDENDSTCLPFLQLIIKELMKQGNIKITVIAEQYPMSENYTWNGISVITLRKKESKLYYKIFRFFRLKHILKKLNKHEKINVIHNFWFSNSVLITDKFAASNSIKHITTLAGQDVLPANPALKKLDSYKGQLFCTSQFQLEKLLENYNVKAEIIELGIEKIKPGLGERTIDLIFCGWINTLKNYNQFIEIVSAINRITALNKVVVCGGGDDLSILREKIKLLGLQSLIEVKGEIPRANVIEQMRKSKILIHTSGYESFGLVLIEGLACGCYVISKPVGVALTEPQIIKCSTTEEFIDRSLLFLDKKVANNLSVFNYPVSKTVSKYLEVYQS